MVTLPFAAIPMIVSGKGFNEKYSAYMAANDHVNSVIVEYVSGIEVVKTLIKPQVPMKNFRRQYGPFNGLH